MFTSLKPGYAPWRLDADEAVFLTMALRNVREVTLKVNNGELALHSQSSPGLILTRVLRDGEWDDRFDPLMPPTLHIPPDYPDRERLEQLAESKSRSSSVWEFDIFSIYEPVHEAMGQRPRACAKSNHTDVMSLRASFHRAAYRRRCRGTFLTPRRNNSPKTRLLIAAIIR